MKVLAIIGSPRKGTTADVVRHFEAALKRHGEVDFETVFLKDLHLGACRGCELCIVKGEDACPLHDDRALLEAKMKEADGLILASPVYALQVTALMKNFLDHFAYLYHRPRMFHKKALLIATGGGMFKQTHQCLKENVQAWGVYQVQKFGTTKFEALAPHAREKSLAKLEKEAARFYQALSSQKPQSPSLFRLIWFRMWQNNANAFREGNPADFRYWQEQGWFGRAFYYDAPINPLKGWVAQGMITLINRLMAKQFA